MRKLLVSLVLILPLMIAPALASSSTADTYKQLDLLMTIFERIRAEYVEEVADEEVIEAAINGMLQSLDPHSSYMGPEIFAQMQVTTRGKYGGLGLEVTTEDGIVKVISPIDETPAARAGMMGGDYITHIDGEPVLGLTLNEAVDRMRGPIDTSITITVSRETVEAPFDVTIIRAEITVKSVRWRTEREAIGYIRITTFNEQTMRGLRDALKALREEHGNDLKGIVLDLRNNPGGLLDQAVAVSDAFLDRGEIVSTRGRRASDSQRWNATTGDLAGGLPIVVLVNAYSASASEIVAGALQDHARATVLGVKTFGKGTVQTVIPIGKDSALRLTTSRYYTPSGRSIQAEGIEPDMLVEQPLPANVRARTVRRESDLKGHLENEFSAGEEAEAEKDEIASAETPAAVPEEETAIPDDAAEAAAESADSEEDAPEFIDVQLQRALDLLEAGSETGQKQAANLN